jgi:hypothetical protein
VSGSPVEQTLILVAAAGLVDQGKVNLISIAPVIERLGDRWPRKREAIWLHVETFLRRQFRPDDVVVRVDEAHFLIAQPGREPLSAQTRCANAAADLMKFFLGDTSPHFVRVKVVEAVEGDQMVVAPVPPHRLETILHARDPTVGRPARVQTTPILTRLGRSVSLTVSLERLLCLQPSPRLIGHQVKAELFDGVSGAPLTAAERARLQPGELADIDVSALKTAIAIRAASPRLTGGLIVPISYLTLTNSSTRYQVLDEVQRMEPSDARSFGWEIVDLEQGVPSGRLAEMVAIARSRSRGVVCRLAVHPMLASKVHAAGATLSAAPPHGGYSELDLLRLEAPLAAALKSVRTVMLHDVPAELLPIATFVGVTHATVSPPSA